jgi:3-(3-hydroxy-phenyl)propionate hydroxylase
MCVLSSTLAVPDRDDWQGLGVAPGSPAIDAPLEEGWLLERLTGEFVFLTNAARVLAPPQIKVIDLSAQSNADLAIERFALSPGAGTLLRPDQYVVGRWKEPDFEALQEAFVLASSGKRP